MTTLRKWSRRFAAAAALAGLAMAAATAPARATAILTVSDGTNAWTQTGDGSSPISIAAADGSWTVLAGGATKPFSGAWYNPDMHLGAIGWGIGKLTISFSDDGFWANGSTDFLTGVGGYLGDHAGLTLDSWTTLGSLGSLGPFTASGAFSDSVMTAQTMSGTYGLTLSANLTHLGPDISSFDAGVKEVPEPGTLALFGAGLLGCVFFLRRRRIGARTLAA